MRLLLPETTLLVGFFDQEFEDSSDPQDLCPYPPFVVCSYHVPPLPAYLSYCRGFDS